MSNDSKNMSQLAQYDLFGREVIEVHQKSKAPEIAPQPPKRLSIVYGTCCQCKKQPATLKSPSGNPASIYCAECGRSRCGIHTIADFTLDGSGLWLDPCAVKKNLQQQSLVSEE